MEQPLTAYEYDAINTASAVNLSDGHAYHELPTALSHIPQEISTLWSTASSMTPRDAENRLRSAWALASGSIAMGEVGTWKVCPTASNSLDIIAAWCASRHMRVAMVEPTFDNLALLFRRRMVTLSPLPLAADEMIASNNFQDADAIVLVTPNNPTGRTYSEGELAELAQSCDRAGKTLIIDNTFRFYRDNTFDDIQVLENSGVEYIVVEDSGKTFPTLEMKASPMLYSRTLTDLTDIYEEVYLCTSPVVALMISSMLDVVSTGDGVDNCIMGLINDRRHRLRDALTNTGLDVALESVESRLPLEWIDCSRTHMHDLEVEQILRTRFGLHVLPGRNFWWSSAGKQADGPLSDGRSDRIRMSLARPANKFEEGIRRLTALATEGGLAQLGMQSC